MLEKIILAIAVTFSLSWCVQIKPQPRVVTIESASHWETVTISAVTPSSTDRSPVFLVV